MEQQRFGIEIDCEGVFKCPPEVVNCQACPHFGQPVDELGAITCTTCQGKKVGPDEAACEGCAGLGKHLIGF